MMRDRVTVRAGRNRSGNTDEPTTTERVGWPVLTSMHTLRETRRGTEAQAAPEAER